ncbi:MAG: BREX-1 system phosphatase PglZ type B [Candidatus Schekmanbacteria bacterium]|nr:BREX-1 system phosphatase PglZ type B [Candidatus Schekmanbacteria bacterium]
MKEATVLDALLSSLAKAAAYNAAVNVAPAAVLWPDQAGQWKPLIPVLRTVLPHLLTLGDYDQRTRTGPATWLKCMLARMLPEASWGDEVVPILYLPGVSRLDLRAIESCPKPLQPLAELQYRGVLWTQQNGRDWTILAFLKTRNGTGLGLDPAQDARTQEAIARALVQLADTAVSSLEGRRLEATDFDRLLTTDPVRDILRWLGDPAGTRNQWGPQVWGAFCSLCRSSYGFDPQTEGELAGAEKLGHQQDKWAAVWTRFAESPRLYPNVPALLRKAEQPRQPRLFPDGSAWPAVNDKDEASLRSSLTRLQSSAAHEAVPRLKNLEEQHAVRRRWVWAELGMSPLAQAMEHLATLADVASHALGGASAHDMGAVYCAAAWRADAAVWRALACVERKADVAAVTAAVRAVYLPWVEAATERLQDIVAKSGFPASGEDARRPVTPSKGECILFADGLRFDVGQALREELESRAMQVTVATRWQGLPSVTATCKPAVSPIANLIAGSSDDGNFLPSVAKTGEALSTHRFRKLLEDAGVEVLSKEATGNPKGSAWCEHGDLDRAGHDEGIRLARRIGEQIRVLRERIIELLDAGWRQVRVLTDHGWLLMPGGLPKVELPAYLAETRWGRCAILKHSAEATSLVVPWRWSADIRVAIPHGIGAYRQSTEYAHGGLSLQECFTPELVVSRPAGLAAEVAIAGVTWVGLRCRVEVTGAASGMTADLRTKPMIASSSLAQGGKPLGEAGKASLAVEDDSTLGMVAVLVVAAADGTVVCKATTTVGGES